MEQTFHYPDVYTSKSTKFGGANPFIIHPEEVKFREGGAKVLTAMGNNEKISAGTPFYFDAQHLTCKFLRCWKVKSVTVSGSNSVILLYKTFLSPELLSTTKVMVAPSSLNGLGKAKAAGTVTIASDGSTYSITVPTADIDTVAAGNILIEAGQRVHNVEVGGTASATGKIKVTLDGAASAVEIDVTSGDTAAVAAAAVAAGTFTGWKVTADGSILAFVKNDGTDGSLSVVSTATGITVTASAKDNWNCKPNNFSTRDTFKGDQNLMSFPRGHFSAYINLINPMPECVKANLNDGLLVAWEYYAEKTV